MDQFKDANYFQLPSQGNVYTMTDLQLANGSRKLLVSSLKREIFCLEYLDSQNDLELTVKEVSFTYIPSGAEIISMDAFNKSRTKNEFVVGVTIIKNSSELNSLETFLNIYSEWEETDDFNIENIAQNCLNVQLNYIPYKLLHTYLISWENDEITNKEIVFVLSGSDHQIHIYREHAVEHVYKELDSRDSFPEFTKTPSPVTWIDIYYSDDFVHRLTSFSCECGYVKFLKTCTKTNKLIYNFSVRLNNYVGRVLLYNEKSSKSSNGFSNNFNNMIEAVEVAEDSRDVFNLIVVNSILPAVIFQDVLKYGLSNYFTLPRHDECNSILTCCEVADIDFDGRREILIGSSAQEIHLLKYKEESWYLKELKKIASPILSIKYIDLNGDGLKELIVLSMRGVHIYQHDPFFVKQTLERKIEIVLLTRMKTLKLK